MKGQFKNLYDNKTVLVTGHTGFKGSWLTLSLLELGAKVVGYSLEPPTVPSLFEILGVKDKINHIIGDVRDQKHLDSVLKKYNPDFVFHLAAQSLVRLSYKEPRLTYETNLMGTINVLEAIRRVNSVRACIVVTSDKCYENREAVYCYKETDPMGGYDPYSSSKGCAELIVNAYRCSFFNSDNYKEHKLALSSVRSGNVIGGGDWSQDRLIPDCINFLSKDEPITIRSPEATRPWQYVLEPLFGYLSLGQLMWQEPLAYSDSWNFGPKENSISKVEDIVKLVIKSWGKGQYQVVKDSKLHEARLLSLDIDKARNILKWEPAYSLDKALEETIGWYKKYYELGKTADINQMYEYSLNQIREYIKQKQGYKTKVS